MLMAQVYKVMIRCPVSHNDIDTGIRTSGRESLSSGIYEGGSVLCPDCHNLHRVLDDGFLDVAHETPDQNVWRPNPRHDDQGSLASPGQKWQTGVGWHGAHLPCHSDDSPGAWETRTVENVLSSCDDLLTESTQSFDAGRFGQRQDGYDRKQHSIKRFVAGKSARPSRGVVLIRASCGGRHRTRTCDPCGVIAVLYQLS